MEAVLTRVAAFVLIIALGYGLKRVGFFKASDFGLIASVVPKITIPCAVVSYFSKITPDFTLFGWWCWASSATSSQFSWGG